MSRPASQRSLGSLLSLGASLVLVIGLLVSIMMSDGRPGTEAEINDGGAWLINRDAGAIGHLNREVLEVTAAIRFTNGGSDFAVSQAAGIIGVLERSENRFALLDERTYVARTEFAVPDGAEMVAFDGGVVFFVAEPLTVWRLSTADLLDVGDLSQEEPLVQETEPGLVSVNPDGSISMAQRSPETGLVQLSTIGPSEREAELAAKLDTSADVTALLATGEQLVYQVDEELRAGAEATILASDVSVIQQPVGDLGAVVAWISNSGQVFLSDTRSGVRELLGDIGDEVAQPPILHRGCVFVVSSNAESPTYRKFCDGSETEKVDLEPGQLELILVNGWVWINDLQTGGSWVSSADTDLSRLDDWGSALASEESDEAEATVDDNSPNSEQQKNPDSDDAEFVTADELDEDSENEPPVASDDLGATRTERPVIIDVVANDVDTDGDVLFVSAIDVASTSDAVIDTVPGSGSIQVIPAAGFVGSINFGYTVSDGRGGTAEALVSVDVLPPGPVPNTAPVAATDVASTRAGSMISLNVLDNDSDPEGDSLLLDSVEVPSGVVSFDVNGQVLFTPDLGSDDGIVELTYTVVDEFGASTDGRIRVLVRLADSNSPPDARNDLIVTNAGSSARLNVLENDFDPDNDSMFVAKAPMLVGAPVGFDEVTDVSLTPAGDFYFVPTVEGTYRFEYLVSDGQNNDKAMIRIEAAEATSSQPPVAVRDDIVIPVGSSRLVYVLDNDYDPNGDVVGIVGWSPVEGLKIREVPGIGLEVTAEFGAPASVAFWYSISDGSTETVQSQVVVLTSDGSDENRPPRLRPDVYEVRAGRLSRLPVLLNDYDPEGGSLAIERVPDLSGSGVGLDVSPDGQYLELMIPDGLIRGFTFGYDVADSAGARAGAVVDVRIIPPNQPNRNPFANLDIARTLVGQPVSIDVIANDLDPDSDFVTVESIASQPTAGSAALGLDGRITYVPSAGFTGTDRFSYVLSDTEGGRTIGEVEIGVMRQPVQNRPPVATPDRFSVSRDAGPIEIDPLANDSDPDGDTLSLVKVGQPNEGEITIEDGVVTYNPPPGPGPDSDLELTVSYEISDGAGHSDEAQISIVLTGTPEPIAPIANDDSAGPVRSRTVAVVDVLANDSDPDGSPGALTVTSTDPAVTVVGGQLEILAGSESAQYSYSITDLDGLSDSALVHLFVVENEAPNLDQLTVTTQFETAVVLDLGAQVNDPDSDPLFFACCDSPRGGQATVLATGDGVLTVEFVPNSGFFGEAGFSYSVDDQNGHMVSGAVLVTVPAPANRPPVVATGVSVAVEAGTSVPFDVTTMVDDPDLGETFTVAVASVPAGVEVSLTGTTLTVTAPANSSGAGGPLEFTVTDAAGESASGSIDLSISPSSAAPPEAVADQASTNQGQPVDIDVLANDIDPLGGGLTITQIGASGGGVASELGGGTVRFTPSPDFFGPTSFVYTVGDATQDLGRVASTTVTIDVIGRPGIGPAPIATADNARVTLTWPSPADNGAPIDQYRLLISDLTDATQQELDLGAQNSYTAAGLTNGHEYEFAVSAHNAAGWGENSTRSLPVRPDTTPDTPAAPQVAFDDSQLLVTWTPPANDGSALTEYKLEIGGGSSQIISLPSATSSYTWTGLANGTEYQFRVVATNAAGDSNPSAWSTPEHPLGPPAAPAAPLATRGNRYLDVDWTTPNSNGDSITDYEVEIESSGQVVAVAGGGTNNYRWADLTNGVEYRFRLRANNRAPLPGGWSPWSSPVKPCSVPDVVTSVSAIRGDQLASLTWATPNEQGCSISSYNLRANGSNVISVGSINSTDFTSLTNGTGYTFEVQAVNEEGAGPWSAATASVIPAGPPTAPTMTGAQPTGVGQISVTWGAASPNGDPIVRQEVRVNGGSPFAVAGSPYVRTGLTNNTAYSFEARVCNGVGCGPWSQAASATTWGPPSAPASISAQSGLNAESNLFWSAPANDGGRAVSIYQVTIAPGGSETASPATTSRNFQSLTNGVTYAFSVVACNEVGCGPAAVTTATPVAPPPVVTVSVGAAYSGVNCASGNCNWIDVAAQNLAPNTSVNVACHSSLAGQFKNYWVTTDSNGGYSGHNCHYGYPGETVWVTVNGTISNSVLWP